MPEAGSCANCPKRTGFNTLLFDAALQDSCTDKNCYNNKLTKNVERQIAEKPQLVQITNEWKTPGNSAVLGRNQYVALNLTAKSAKSKKPLSPYQKPCKHMSEAIVVDGTERGRTVKVCAEPNCPVHFADRRAPNPEQTAKEREQRRKELERQKLEATVRHRTLAEVLKRIGAPLDRADLALVASALLNKLEPLRKELLARRHKLVEGTASEVTHPQVQQAIARIASAAGRGRTFKTANRSRFTGMHRSGANQRPGCADRNGKAASRGCGQTAQSRRAGVHREACEARRQTKESCQERHNEDRSLAYCETTQALGNCPSAVLILDSHFLIASVRGSFLPSPICAQPEARPSKVSC